MGTRRFRVQMLVDVDTEDVRGDDSEGIFCGTTGDSYDNWDEFFEHQLGRDLQCMKLVPGFRVETVKTDTE